MKTIYKYPLNLNSENELSMPAGAQLLTVQVQGELMCLWALIDQNTEERESRTIIIYGTGHPIPALPEDFRYRYISTFQLHNGALVFHAFELLSYFN